jgi:hypothetical protein
MVDFPEGYGFKAGTKPYPMQERFTVVLGVFTAGGSNYPRKSFSRRSPYKFEEIAVIRKEDNDTPIRGILLGPDNGPPIEGTLQQVVTALCTIHRLKGGKTE